MRKVILLAVLLMIMALPVSAHSGRTDGNGGHTNHSTGEYHYHHGYPAHDHYDIDGDGIIDCPYTFEDKASHKDNSNQITYDKGEDESKGVTIGGILESILVAVTIGIAVSYFLSYIFRLFWGDSKGCSITLVSFVVISVVALIWILCVRF